MLGALAKRVAGLSLSSAKAAPTAAVRIAPTVILPTARAASSSSSSSSSTSSSPRAPLPLLGRGGGASRRGLSTEAAAPAGADLPLEALEKPKPPRNSLVGMVVSDRMDKSIVVRVSRIKLFLPYMVRKRTFKKIMAHDEENACGVGDMVRIKPSRPLSKRKRFTLHEILRRDPKLSVQTQQTKQQQHAGAAGASASASS